MKLGGLALGLSACALVACGAESELGSRTPSSLPRDAHASVAYDGTSCAQNEVVGCMRACKSDDPKACNLVGVMLEFDPDGNDDPQLASGFYKRACDSSYYPGCNNLAWLYLGGRGVPKDKLKAMHLFTQAYDASRVACNQGDLAGCIFAGDASEHGRGTDVDLDRAVAFYRVACDGGDRRGCDDADRAASLGGP